MADQPYYSVFTKKGLELLTEAIRNGTKLGITHMAFGDGSGSLPIPNESFTKLVNEVHRTQLNSLSPDPNNANWLRAEAIIASAIGGFNIRELGLYAGTTLVAYSNYPATYKPNPSDGTARIMTFRMVLQIDNTASFELKIDADIVLATIASVDAAKLELYSSTVAHVNSIDDIRTADLPIRAYQVKNHLDYRNGGLFMLDETDTSTIDDSVFNIVSASGARYKRQMPQDGTYQIDWWLDPKTDLNDYSLVVNKCSNFFDPSQGNDWGDIYNGWDWTGKTRLCPYNVTIVGSGGTRQCIKDIVIYAWTNNWDFNATNLDFSSVTTSGNTHFWIKKSTTTSVKNYTIKGSFSKSDILLNADGTLKEVQKLNVGILLHTNAPNINGVACRGITFDGVHVEGVARPIQYGNNAFIHSWNNSSLKNFYEALSLKTPNVTNTGENIKFNSVHMTDGFRWTAAFLEAVYKASSFDYTGADTYALQKAFEGQSLFAAKGKFIECHFETGNTHSRWLGYFFGDDVDINDSVLWLAETASNGSEGVRYCRFDSLVNAKGSSKINGLNVANADLNGNEGCWISGGGSISLKNITYPKGQNQWANFYLGNPNNYGDYASSALSGMAVDASQALVEVEKYKARHRFKEYYSKADGLSNITFDATAHTIILNTKSTDKTNAVGFYVYVPINFDEKQKVSTSVLSFNRTQNNSDYTLNTDCFSVILRDGVETVLDRAVWGPSGKAGAYLNAGFANGLDEISRATHLRMFVCATEFYTTTADTTASINIRCPRMWLIGTNGFTTAQTH